MKRIVALLVLALSTAAIAASAADSTHINGWISDSMCGAKHAGTGADCVKKCIEGGMAPVFVDEAKKAVWTIDNPDCGEGVLWRSCHHHGNRRRGQEERSHRLHRSCQVGSTGPPARQSRLAKPGNLW